VVGKKTKWGALHRKGEESSEMFYGEGEGCTTRFKKTKIDERTNTSIEPWQRRSEKKL